MGAVVKIPTTRLGKARIGIIKLFGAPDGKAVGEGVANLLFESGGNILLESGGVILIN